MTTITSESDGRTVQVPDPRCAAQGYCPATSCGCDKAVAPAITTAGRCVTCASDLWAFGQEWVDRSGSLHCPSWAATPHDHRPEAACTCDAQTVRSGCPVHGVRA